MRRLWLLFLAPLLMAASTPAIPYEDFASAFDRFASRTESLPEPDRVHAFIETFNGLAPGLYADPDPASLDRRIARALADFPAIRARYLRTIERFPAALEAATAQFRRYFPGFTPPMPIYLAHELGMRDGGSDVVGGRKVMLFGADVIARIHDDDSLLPFIEHELFHLEHARHFADCDQFWCPLWQEGLATYAASVMTRSATDRQLLLDLPQPIRAAVDANWTDALCLVAQSFDSAEAERIAQAFTGGQHPSGLPSRYGYYVGLRLAEAAARSNDLGALAQLGDEAARPAVRAALVSLLETSHAGCAPPPGDAGITHASPRPA
jgi:hypothetical protein